MSTATASRSRRPTRAETDARILDYLRHRSRRLTTTREIVDALGISESYGRERLRDLYRRRLVDSGNIPGHQGRPTAAFRFVPQPEPAKPKSERSANPQMEGAPTPEEIRAACEAIRAEWPEQRHRRYEPEPVATPQPWGFCRATEDFLANTGWED